jgi:hypothetical protein
MLLFKLRQLSAKKWCGKFRPTLFVKAYALRSLFFGRSDEEPHLRQFVARTALRALHFMQTLTLRSLASASGNLIYE